jgi:hypothetical protein
MIRWETCQREFAPDGALRDLYVQGTRVEDWQRLLDTLRRRYSLEYFVDNLPQPMPAIADEAFKLRDKASISLRIRTGRIAVQAHFFTPDEIEFDIDPREVDSQASLDELLGFVQLVGDTLGKEVRLSYENDGQRPFITYQPSERAFQYRELAP